MERGGGAKKIISLTAPLVIVIAYEIFIFLHGSWLLYSLYLTLALVHTHFLSTRRNTLQSGLTAHLFVFLEHELRQTVYPIDSSLCINGRVQVHRSHAHVE